jgi:hypothetical protein
MTKKRFVFLVMFAFLYCKIAYSQDLISKTVSWDNNHEKLFALAEKEKNLSHIENADCTFLIPKTTDLRFYLSSFQGEIAQITLLNNEINTKPELNVQEIIIRKKVFYSINITPTYLENGRVMRIKNYQINSSPLNNLTKKTIANRIYSLSSVLSNGEIYKCALTESGIYKIDLALLRSLGINTAGLNPSTIQVFAREGGNLPRVNTDILHDDLVEIPSLKIGLTDNSFDEGDALIIYAASSKNIKRSNGFIDISLNNYDERAYIYIKVNGSTSKSIPNTANEFNNAYPMLSYLVKADAHELDAITKISLEVKSGKNFVGEDFEFKSQHDFTFSIPNILPNDTVVLHSYLAGRTPIGTSNNFSIYVNNNLKEQVPFNGISFDYEDPYALTLFKSSSIIHSSESFNLSVRHNPLNSESNGWIDRIVYNAKVLPKYTSAQQVFYIPSTANNYNLNLEGGNASVQIWNITDDVNYSAQAFSSTNGSLSFGQSFATTSKIIVFEPNQAFSLTAIGKVNNQNLHALAGTYNMVIVSAGAFMSQAQQLAQHKSNTMGLNTLVVLQDEIYNEFGGGRRDVTAIRDFLKMLYDRSNNNELKYVLLFGDGSFDNKGLKYSTNYVSPTTSYVSDEYLALLDDGEGAYNEFNSSKEGFDISIGRFPVTNTQQAQDLVNKVIAYESPTHKGDWKNKVLLFSDDGDTNLHLNQTEGNAGLISALRPAFNIDKVYADAYKQVSTPAGSRYPDVNQAFVDKLNNGRLFINYTGHGGEVGLGHERFISLADIRALSNADKLCLFITATCSFTRWDDPARISAGEETILNSKGGAIALFTTSRIVFSSSNYTLNQALLNAMLDSNNIAKDNSMGNIFSTAKNNLPASSSTLINSRNFSLIGDPSIKLGLSNYKIRTTQINQQAQAQDTLKALQKITIEGEIVDLDGNVMTGFNGIIYPNVYDKEQTLQTLSNDNNSADRENYSPVTSFNIRKSILYRGKATVKDGKFSFSFIVPKDISYEYGKGKISYYAENGSTEIAGFDTSIVVGGFNNQAITDTKGPEITVKLNNQNFANGGLTSPNPSLNIELKDENGINTIGNGIGHDITATLTKPNGQKEVLVLNDYYQSNVDDYTSGSIQYNYTNLEKGNYTLKVKSWDIVNNSSESTIQFNVAENSDLELSHVLNYPNPFTTNTEFQFEHNQNLGTALTYQINIYTISGKLVKSLHGSTVSPSNRINGIFWNGLDDYGDKIGKGVYVYNLKVKTNDGKTKEVIEKLIIL